MKKWILVFLFFCVLALSGVYYFVPTAIVVSSIRNVNAFQHSAVKLISNKEKLKQCFENIAKKKDSTYTYKAFNYNIKNIGFNLTEITISNNDINVVSNLMPVINTTDSTILLWRTEIKTSLNPLDKIKKYYTAKKLKESMAGLIDEMKKYLDNPLNTYGIVVNQIRLTDSTLISIKIKTAAEPTVNEIYAQVNKLEAYAKSKNVTPTNTPMLNVKKIDDAHFESMVGLPISKRVEETKDIKLKRMPFGGFMYITEIKGGYEAIKIGFEKLRIFAEDANRASPAIPYQLMITNRVLEKDSTKWITKLYHPII